MRASATDPEGMGLRTFTFTWIAAVVSHYRPGDGPSPCCPSRCLRYKTSTAQPKGGCKLLTWNGLVLAERVAATGKQPDVCRTEMDRVGPDAVQRGTGSRLDLSTDQAEPSRDPPRRSARRA